MNTAQSQTVEQFSLFSGPAVRQPRKRRSNGGLRKANGQFLAARKGGKLWQENALQALRKFISQIKSDKSGTFTFEDFRLHCGVRDMPEPANVNAWGALPAQACRLKLCEWTGSVTQAVRPSAHSRLIKVWRAV